MRSFAIAGKAVTVAEFKRFAPAFSHSQIQRSPEPTCPILGVTWYEAAAYCNWLSKQEGIPEDQWCYEPNASGQYAAGMKLAVGWSKRIGYRLPSDAEWEYACRAGAVTSRYYGRSEELLDKYAWYSAMTKDERTFPAASLKPNDFGLFDMLGNEGTWCQDRFELHAGDRGEADRSRTPGEIVTDTIGRVVRGAAFSSHANRVRCACRDVSLPTIRAATLGLRGRGPATIVDVECRLAEILAGAANEQPQFLANLLMDADAEQFA